MNLPNDEPIPMMIAGGGIVGLVLAMSLQRQLGITPVIYEKANQFVDEVGAGMGMYPNGLRVLRDIDPELLNRVRAVAWPYQVRRWERHDGTEICQADENVLSGGDATLAPIGIRRWKLQKVLYEYATQVLHIPIHFGLATEFAEMIDDDMVRVELSDGSELYTRVLWACDGGKSVIRQRVVDDEKATPLQYTGVTCLMGICHTLATPGIAFPSSNIPDFHAVYFPTDSHELCFQLHFPVHASQADTLSWGNLSQSVGQAECYKLAKEMQRQGWHERYWQPLLHDVAHAVRVGFCLLEQPLQRWVKERIVLLGDAAHPPVPYLGQGAQQGLEDVGVAVSLLQHYCYNKATKSVDLTRFQHAMDLYQEIRIPRSQHMLELAQQVGRMHAGRSGSTSKVTDRRDMEMILKGEVLMYGTLPSMFAGADHDYKQDAEKAIAKDDDDNGSMQPRVATAEERQRAFDSMYAAIERTKARDDAGAEIASPRSSMDMTDTFDQFYFI